MKAEIIKKAKVGMKHGVEYFHLNQAQHFHYIVWRTSPHKILLGTFYTNSRWNPIVKLGIFCETEVFLFIPPALPAAATGTERHRVRCQRRGSVSVSVSGSVSPVVQVLAARSTRRPNRLRAGGW